jgi:chromosome segregation ATPase
MAEDKILQKLEDHDKQFEKISVKLIEHDELLKPLCEDVKTLKTDIKNIANNQEQMITILKRLDEDRIFTHEWVRRLEKDVEDTKAKTQEHEVEIKKMKTQLNIA